LPTDILLILSAPSNWQHPKDFISLKPKPEKLAKKDPAKSRVKNRD
jgi:hypothetical protein